MAPIVLHGASLSTCTRKVAMIAKERNIPYELVTVDLRVAEHKQPPHLEHQPFGQIPYIVVRHIPFPLHPKAHSYAHFSAVEFSGRRWVRAVRVPRHRTVPRDAWLW